VVAPLRVCYNVWPAEVKKWGYEFSVGILHGPDKLKVLNEDHDIYVINPEGLVWFASQMAHGFARKWFAYKFWLIVDESSLFRNGRSKRFKTLKKLLKYFNRRTILTGTPAPNGLEGLWGQLYILDRGDRLGEYITAFRNRWFYPSGYGGYTYMPQEGAKEKIYSAIKDIVMHKGREELNLPPLINNKVVVSLDDDPVARNVYSEMKDEFIADVGERGLVAAINGAVMNGKLRQITAGAVYNEDHEAIEIHSKKLEALDDLIEELEGQPLMIFYEFEFERDRLLKRYKQAKALGGGTSPKQGMRIEEDWNAGNIPILLLHPKSGGHGLNLQKSSCHDLCWMTIPWDAELYEQAYSRVWRQGVDDSVTMHHIIAIDTIDEQVVQALINKTKLQDELKAALTR